LRIERAPDICLGVIERRASGLSAANPGRLAANNDQFWLIGRL
jgi:hypothetical protein